MQHRPHRPHGPAKLPRALAYEEAAAHRNFCCGVYNMCLEVVVRRQWPSFTCRPCSLWDRRPGENNLPEPAVVLTFPQQYQIKAK